MKEITLDEFKAKYPLLENHLKINAPWHGCMFHIDGPELEFVRQQDTRTIWTLHKTDDGVTHLLSGPGSGNVVGYLVSRNARPDDNLIRVQAD